MSNFYTDDPDLQRQLETLDLRRIVALREDDFEQAHEFAYAPRDYDDALDSYRRTLEIVGDIAGEFVAPRAEEVDRAGATLVDGEVCYAPGMQEALDRLTQADLMGITLPRRYGGLNFPVTVSVMIVEMISRADPALMNVFGLQDIAETVNKFASRRAQAGLPAALRLGRGHRLHGAHRARGRQRPAERAAQGRPGRRRRLAPVRREALHHQRLRRRRRSCWRAPRRAPPTPAACRCSSTSATST